MSLYSYKSWLLHYLRVVKRKGDVTTPVHFTYNATENIWSSCLNWRYSLYIVVS